MPAASIVTTAVSPSTLRLWASVACFVIALLLWMRVAWLLVRLRAHRAGPRRAGERLRLLRPVPGAFTPDGERMRRRLLGLGAAAIVLHALAALL